MSDIRTLLAGLHDAKLEDEVNEALQSVVAAVREHGGSGAVTIKLKVATDGAQRVRIGADLTSKRPQRKRNGRVYFATDNGGLSEEDPRQGRLPHITALPSAKGDPN